MQPYQCLLMIHRQTRLHSSRMRTARVLTVSPSILCMGGVCSGGCLLLGRGVCPQGGVSVAWGVCCQGVSAAGGVSAPRGVVSQHALRQTPPPWTESQTHVKTLPCPNFVAGGKNWVLSWSQ